MALAFLFHRLGSFFANLARAPRPASGSLSLTSPPRMIAFVPQSAPVSAEEAVRDEGMAAEASRLCAAPRGGGVPRRPHQGAHLSPDHCPKSLDPGIGQRALSKVSRRSVPLRSQPLRESSSARSRARTRSDSTSRGQPTIPGVVSLRARAPARASASRSPTIVFFFFAREAFGRNRARNKMMPPCACLLQARSSSPARFS